MKRFMLFLAAALMVSTVLAGFKYEGEWGKWGTGDGEFMYPISVSVAPNGNVYATEKGGGRVQYFTSTGSFLGKWSVPTTEELGVAVAPSGNVYTGGCDGVARYYTPTGSLLGSWGLPSWCTGGDVAPNGNVYGFISLHGGWGTRVCYYTPTGSLLGSWSLGEGSGRLGIAPNGDVYATHHRTGDGNLLRFTSTGSLRGSWGPLYYPAGLDVAPDGRVFVALPENDVVRYYTPSGSLLGSWGGEGSGPGKFIGPDDVHFSPDGKYIYVADCYNHRIQYFSEENPAVAPASLGRIKATYR
jgi:DNA-binding beta-propeller fold protein YncE